MGQIRTQVPQLTQVSLTLNFLMRMGCIWENALLSRANSAFFGGFFPLFFMAFTAAATSIAFRSTRSLAFSTEVGGKHRPCGISQMQVE